MGLDFSQMSAAEMIALAKLKSQQEELQKATEALTKSVQSRPPDQPVTQSGTQEPDAGPGKVQGPSTNILTYPNKTKSNPPKSSSQSLTKLPNAANNIKCNPEESNFTDQEFVTVLQLNCNVSLNNAKLPFVRELLREHDPEIVCLNKVLLSRTQREVDAT